MAKFTFLVSVEVKSIYLQIYILKTIGGFNAISYFYTILEFDTVLETWLEVSNMRSARGGPGVSVIDFNHVQNFVSDCSSGRFLNKLKIMGKYLVY